MAAVDDGEDGVRFEGIGGEPVGFILHDKSRSEHAIELFPILNDDEGCGGVGLEFIGDKVAVECVERRRSFPGGKGGRGREQEDEQEKSERVDDGGGEVAWER